MKSKVFEIALIFLLLSFLYLHLPSEGKPQPSSSSLWSGEIFDVKRRYENELFSLPNVIAVGVGWKDGQYIIKVHTTKPFSTLSTVPQSLEGYPVEIVESQEFLATSDAELGMWRPVPGGVSVGPQTWGSGTIATAVYDKDTGERMLLSNNHVLAKSNSEKNQWGHVDDPIFQHAELDSNEYCMFHVVASLYKWVNIQTGILGDITNSPTNYVDAAVALDDIKSTKISDSGSISNKILNIGLVSRTNNAMLGMQVKKNGRTTGLTYGVIEEVAVTTLVNYRVYVAKFSDQICITSVDLNQSFSLAGATVIGVGASVIKPSRPSLASKMHVKRATNSDYQKRLRRPKRKVKD